MISIVLPSAIQFVITTVRLAVCASDVPEAPDDAFTTTVLVPAGVTELWPPPLGDDPLLLGDDPPPQPATNSPMFIPATIRIATPKMRQPARFFLRGINQSIKIPHKLTVLEPEISASHTFDRGAINFADSTFV